MSKYYLAYGSNLSMAQMAQRCPHAIYVGTATLEGYELLFKGSKTGSYLTVEEKEGSKVPVLVWKISDRDERKLDRYEGHPNFYYKKLVKVAVHSLISGQVEDVVEAMIYIMHEERLKGLPHHHYYKVCLEGYNRFGFDRNILEKALIESVGKKYGEQFLEELECND